MQNFIHENIKTLFLKIFKENITTISRLPQSGSSRIYYRIKSKNHSVIATYNPDKKENTAFFHLSEIFKKNKIYVPGIYASDTEKMLYLQEDLGNETLFERVLKDKKSNKFSDELIELYKKTINQLVNLQINISNKINYSLCYPRAEFDRQSIMWDLNYFKYNFLKFTDVTFDEQLLENDFNKFAYFLRTADCQYFLYRDFQSRNIMLHNNNIYFIDYQGGRKGALQYDLASLLYDAKADIPKNIRKELLTYYLKTAKKLIKINENKFIKYFYAYALIRIMQAMGAYGYRGLFEKKQHFTDSIPYGLKNLAEILPETEILSKLPELKKITKHLIESKKLKNIIKNNKLKVVIKSFSYKRGIPYDNSGNGGGFVFDCRFIENPGKIEKYKKLCGKDKEVINFLEKLNETHNFLNSIKNIISSAIKNYQSINFKNIAVNFGCTGGQHRSVFFAEKTAEFLTNNFDINVELIHTEQF